MQFGLLLMPVAAPGRNGPEILRHSREMVVMGDRLGMVEVWDLTRPDGNIGAISDPLQFFASTLAITRDIAFGVQVERVAAEQLLQFQALSGGRLIRIARSDGPSDLLRSSEVVRSGGDIAFDMQTPGRILPPWLQTDALARHAATARAQDAEEWRLARSILVTDTDATAQSYLSEPACLWRADLGVSQEDAGDVVVAGSPDTVTARLAAIIDGLGVPISTLLMTQIEWDRPSLHRKSFELFSTEVMPRLRRHFEAARPAG